MDIALMQRVKSLMDDLGVNLAGVEVILHMIERMNKLQDELEQARKQLKGSGRIQRRDE
jgi:MerR family transcriptional regulator/heat shock protein HspR